MSQTEFSKLIQIGIASLSRYENDSVPISSDVIAEVCRVTGASADWLLFGEGGGDSNKVDRLSNRWTSVGIGEVDHMSNRWTNAESGGAMPPTLAKTVAENQREIPVLSTISAGQLVANGDADTPVGVGALGYITAADPKDENAFALKVEGASMAPVLFPGDYVVVSPRRREDLRYQICVVRIRGEDVTLKYVKQRGDTIVLESENPAYRPIEVPVAEAEIIGRVVAFQRNLQE